ncbi:hypothetical protein [Algoriphagus boritolerans]|nr:hypothetical protein [Algoriphagus boritolerans]
MSEAEINLLATRIKLQISILRPIFFENKEKVGQKIGARSPDYFLKKLKK